MIFAVKRKRIILLITLFVLLTSTIVLCSLFWHRNISRLVEMDDIVEIKLIDEIQVNKKDARITVIEKEEFIDIISNVKYRKRYLLAKLGDVIRYEITYSDGSKIYLANSRYDKRDKDGNYIDGFQYILYGDLFLDYIGYPLN